MAEIAIDSTRLMVRRIRKILLICNHYDSFSLEEDGRLDEQIVREYSELRLSNPPSIVRVESTIDALKLLLGGDRYDLVITMFNAGDMDVFEFSGRMKAVCPDTPLVLLTSVAREIQKKVDENDTSNIDYVFCWNSSTDLIIAIIKLIEDKMNADRDILESGVRAILLVEDSIRYYSTYLPLLYKLVLQQNIEALQDALNESQQNLRKRSRPKILMAGCYEEAINIYERYKDNLLGVISDVGFVIHKGDAPETEQMNGDTVILPDVTGKVPADDLTMGEKEAGVSTDTQILPELSSSGVFDSSEMPKGSGKTESNMQDIPVVAAAERIPVPEESEGPKPVKKKNKKSKKKRRRRKRKNPLRFVLYFFLMILILIMMAVIAVSVKLYPTFVEMNSQMTKVISEMDSSDFVRAGNTEIYDAKNNLIGKFGSEKYVYLSYREISPYVIKGYVATEDKNFYEHIGIDVQALTRAAIALVKNKGHITQGGSTITQQVVKNNLLTQEQTYSRKITEIFLALGLERAYTKKNIMEFYCNSNYYGNLCYGIEAASEYYFNKKASDLTVAEAAILVGTSNSPNNNNPVADYERSMNKKKQIITNMLECGYIDQATYEEALAERPEITQTSSAKGSSGNSSYMTTYAVHCATLALMQKDGFEFRYTFDSQEDYQDYQEKYNTTYSAKADAIRTGGYTIRTTLDPDIQAKLQLSLDHNLAPFDEMGEDGLYEMQGGAVCIDNQSQMVVAIVGGRGEDDTYNRGFLAKRQPGSSIKPLLDYGPALNEGFITPATKFTDKVVEQHGYAPKNAGDSYHGTVTVREALARSLNTVAFQIFLNTGRETCMSYLDKLHFNTLAYMDQEIDSVSIGGFTNGVTVTDMARGYATLANEGQYSSNTCISSIEYYTDGVIYVPDGKTTEVYSKETAYILSDMMQGVFRESYGTAHRLDTDWQIYAGKTGTTNNNKDAWFCGFSKYYTCAVYVGYDMPEEVEGLTGSSYPGSVWSEFMDSMHLALPAAEFECPGTVQLMDSYHKDERIAVTYFDDVYHSRPYGWDYVSALIGDKYEKTNAYDKYPAWEDTDPKTDDED